jgi:hypothetical protein
MFDRNISITIILSLLFLINKKRRRRRLRACRRPKLRETLITPEN